MTGPHHRSHGSQDSHDEKDCLELAERLSEYLDGELPPDLVEKVREHFEGCSNCERFLDSLNRVKGLGSWLPSAELPPERLQSLKEEIRRRLDG